MSAENEEEVFLDAKEEVTPRRSGRKRRSTAGNTTPATTCKRAKSSKMPTERSPGQKAKSSASTKLPANDRPPGPCPQADMDAFWSKMSGMLGGLESRMKNETDEVKEQLSAAVDTLGDLGSRVDKAERRLEGLADEVNSIVERKLASREVPQPEEETRGQQSYASALMMGRSKRGLLASISPEKKKEESYWKCRRMLRLRPIAQGDTVSGVRDFMVEHLGLGPHFMESVGPFETQRVPYGPSAKIKNEVIVTYQSTDVRDAVKGAAKNPAGAPKPP